MASWSILAGAVFLIPFAAWEGAFAGIPELSAARWWAVALLGVFAGSLGYFLWIWALQCSTPTRSAVFIVLNPMTATLLGAVLLAETISPAFLLGLAGVVAGILVANWQPGSRVASPGLSHRPHRAGRIGVGESPRRSGTSLSVRCEPAFPLRKAVPADTMQTP